MTLFLSVSTICWSALKAKQWNSISERLAVQLVWHLMKVTGCKLDTTHSFCLNQCCLETENDNNQNFLERLSWRALFLNLPMAGDFPAAVALPPRGDALEEKQNLDNWKYSKCIIVFELWYFLKLEIFTFRWLIHKTLAWGSVDSSSAHYFINLYYRKCFEYF